MLAIHLALPSNLLRLDASHPRIRLRGGSVEIRGVPRAGSRKLPAGRSRMVDVQPIDGFARERDADSPSACHFA
jgi:hypothetical protein